MKRDFKRGDIILYEPPNTVGSEQRGERPWIVISNDKGNEFSPTLMLLAVTTKVQKKLPTHTALTDNCGLLRKSIATAEQVKTIDKSVAGAIIGHVPENEFYKIEDVIAVECGFSHRFMRLSEQTSIRECVERYA